MAEASKRRVTKKEEMTAEQLAAYEKRLGPKPAYVAYKVDENGGIEIVLATRSAEEVLAAVDKDRDLKYARTMIK